MNLPPLEPESVHDGDWLTWDSLWALVPLQASHYYKRFHHLFVGNEDDLTQAGYLALLELQKALGTPDRVRELPALSALHRGMVSEIKGNRRQSGKLSVQLPFVDHQLNDKQKEMLSFWRRETSRAAHSPAWEMVWLSVCLEWTPDQISEYMRMKTHKYYDVDEVKDLIKLGLQRIKRNMSNDVNLDIRLLHFYN